MTQTLRETIIQQALSFESLGFRVYFSFKLNRANELNGLVILEEGLHYRYKFSDPDLNIIVKQLAQLYLSRTSSKELKSANDDIIEKNPNICLTCHQEIPFDDRLQA